MKNIRRLFSKKQLNNRRLLNNKYNKLFTLLLVEVSNSVNPSPQTLFLFLPPAAVKTNELFIVGNLVESGISVRKFQIKNCNSGPESTNQSLEITINQIQHFLENGITNDKIKTYQLIIVYVLGQ